MSSVHVNSPDINDAWSWDFYGLRAKVNSPQGYINDFHVDRIADAINIWSQPEDNPDNIPQQDKSG